MKANELRIGNLLNHKEDGVVLINGVHPFGDNIWRVNGKLGGWRKINEFEPIPLTEEWLVKFGFDSRCKYIKEIKEDYGIEKCLSIEIEFNYEELGDIYTTICAARFDSMGVIDQSCQEFHVSYLKHVHQLQNLYFALTGQELEIIS